MVTNVQFICLANSKKLGGRCVAGLRLNGTGWFRPVSDLTDGTLSRSHYLLADGQETGLLDIVEVAVSRPRSEPHQPENWELVPKPWRLVRRIAPAKAVNMLRPALVPGPVILENVSDRVAHSALTGKPVKASFALVEPSSIEWYITSSLRGNRQTRCLFNLCGARYNLSVTDLKIERTLANHDFGVHPRGAANIQAKARVFLTISLGEPFNGDCYKLVAAVLVFP